MNMRKLLSLLLALAMLLSMTAAFAEEAAAPEEEERQLAEDGSMPLVVAISTLSEKFSPFYAETGYDQDVVGLTQVGLMTTDRMGGIIYNGIEGETVSYNGTDYFYQGIADLSVEIDEETNITTYTAKLRDDIKFSDGEPLTADDVLFTYYVYLDPAYVGSTSLSSYKIIGLQDYRLQRPAELIEKYDAIARAIYAAGEGYEATADDTFTAEQYDALWGGIKAEWVKDTEAIANKCVGSYLDAYCEAMLGVAPADFTDEMKAAFGMSLWGFAETDTEAKTLTTASGKVFDFGNGEWPTFEDFYNECYAAYEGDPVAYWETEAADDTDVLETAINAFILEQSANEPEASEGIKSISGITKVDDYTVQVKTYGYEAPAVYSILGISVVPMHYYGDVEQWDPDNGLYGHPFGDLSVVESKTSTPVGAGPYKFVKYENRVVYYEANENYYLGAPLTKYFQYKETYATEVAAGLASGANDGGELSGNKDNFNLLRSYNDNGELVGNVITTYSVDNLGYGYIGINADTVNVGGVADSEESKDLRKGLATVLAVYRDAAFDSYYGDAANVINYPISSTSWAAPQVTDEGYQVAFSVDVDGNPIYTADMTAEDKYAAALEAAKGFLKAAGYTFDEATGMFTAAPEGAKMSYEVIIPADGIGDHPSFAVLTDASNALATIGIELRINDPADSNVLWDAIDACTNELWCAAWGSTIDPDMYQVYHSSNVIGKGGTDSNNYHIASATLDELIIEARQSDDQAFRKTCYRAALEEIMDWAVEIPAYQRQNIIIASTERIDIDTVTPDVTTYYGWLAEGEKIVMRAAEQ